jgi:hypothetical protein
MKTFTDAKTWIVFNSDLTLYRLVGSYSHYFFKYRLLHIMNTEAVWSSEALAPKTTLHHNPEHQIQSAGLK